MYVSPGSLFSNPSFYTLHAVRKTPRRDVLTLLCSLLNTVINSSKATNVTIASMAGKVPYNHLVFKGEDPRTALVGMCLQVLCVLLDFQSGPARDASSGNGDTVTSAPTSKTNAFRYFLAKLASHSSSTPGMWANSCQASYTRLCVHTGWHHACPGTATRRRDQLTSGF